MIITTKNYMTWFIGGMVLFMGLALGLTTLVDVYYIFLLFGAIGWIFYMLFYKADNIYQDEMAKWTAKSDQNVADHMRDERLQREEREKNG